MSYSDTIADQSEALVKRFGTRDPFKIAKGLGITIMWSEDFNRLKGMYRVIKRNRYIILNSNLDEETANIVCGHEIGHDQLHRELAKGNGLLEFMLYNMTTRAEYEANVYAANLLLPDDDVLNLIFNYNYDAEQIARQMHTDINLVALKISHLNHRGYNLNYIDHRANFLK